MNTLLSPNTQATDAKIRTADDEWYELGAAIGRV